jgi:RHS repeat-associated protein
VALREVIRVSGGNNGLFYLYSDHLGSASLLVNGSNNPVAGSRTWYLPFGGYRPGSAPSQTITDRDFTGQRENMELGLLYYNARFYAPYINRFLSADSIVPDPANPQSFNRYSYVLNRPLSFTDPTGHRPSSGCDDYEGCSVPDELGANGAYAITYNGEEYYFGSFDLAKATLDFLNRLQQEGILNDPVITNSFREPADAHRYSTAYNIIEGNLSQEVLRENPIDLDGNVWFREDWLYNDPQCVYEHFRCGATKWNASSLGVMSGNIACDNYDCYPTVNFALEGYPAGDPRRLPNNDNVPVSQHVSGLAVDITGNWSIDPWDPRIDEIAAEYGLYRPYNPSNSVFPEFWHFEGTR